MNISRKTEVLLTNLFQFFFNLRKISQNQFETNNFNVSDRIYITIDMDDIIINKTAYNMHDCICCTDIHQKFVAQTSALRSPLNNTSNINKFNLEKININCSSKERDIRKTTWKGNPRNKRKKIDKDGCKEERHKEKVKNIEQKTIINYRSSLISWLHSSPLQRRCSFVEKICIDAIKDYILLYCVKHRRGMECSSPTEVGTIFTDSFITRSFWSLPSGTFTIPTFGSKEWGTISIIIKIIRFLSYEHRVFNHILQ